MPRVSDLPAGEPLPAYAHPGGYPIMYVDKSNNTICPACANAMRHDEYGNAPLWYDVYWEGPALQCEECGSAIESAYGDPDEEPENEREIVDGKPV